MWAETLLSLFLNMWLFAEGKSVCVHVCACIACMCVCTCMQMCAYVRVCIVCLCALGMRVCVHVWMCMHVCIWECAWVCMHVCVCLHVCVSERERERARDRETESERTNLPWGNILSECLQVHLCWECPESKTAMFALHIFTFLSNFDNIPFTSPTFSHTTPIYVPSLSRKPYFWDKLTKTNLILLENKLDH